MGTSQKFTPTFDAVKMKKIFFVSLWIFALSTLVWLIAFQADRWSFVVRSIWLISFFGVILGGISSLILFTIWFDAKTYKVYEGSVRSVVMNLNDSRYTVLFDDEREVRFECTKKPTIMGRVKLILNGHDELVQVSCL